MRYILNVAPFYYNFAIRVQLAAFRTDKQRFREERQLEELDVSWLDHRQGRTSVCLAGPGRQRRAGGIEFRFPLFCTP